MATLASHCGQNPPDKLMGDGESRSQQFNGVEGINAKSNDPAKDFAKGLPGHLLGGAGFGGAGYCFVDGASMLERGRGCSVQGEARFDDAARQSLVLPFRPRQAAL